MQLKRADTVRPEGLDISYMLLDGGGECGMRLSLRPTRHRNHVLEMARKKHAPLHLPVISYTKVLVKIFTRLFSHTAEDRHQSMRHITPSHFSSLHVLCTLQNGAVTEPVIAPLRTSPLIKFLGARRGNNETDRDAVRLGGLNCENRSI